MAYHDCTTLTHCNCALFITVHYNCTTIVHYDWQVVSRGRAEGPSGVQGRVVLVPRLEDVQYNSYSHPTVLLVDQLSGEVPASHSCLYYTLQHNLYYYPLISTIQPTVLLVDQLSGMGAGGSCS
jgi:hypothetical protein